MNKIIEYYPQEYYSYDFKTYDKQMSTPPYGRGVTEKRGIKYEYYTNDNGLIDGEAKVYWADGHIAFNVIYENGVPKESLDPYNPIIDLKSASNLTPSDLEKFKLSEDKCVRFGSSMMHTRLDYDIPFFKNVIGATGSMIVVI